MNKMKTVLKFLKYTSFFVIAILVAIVSGCSDTTTPTDPVYVNNPNVKSFDSISVYEDSAAGFTHTGLNLLNGTNTVDTDPLRDCSLNDHNNAGLEFYLQNGQLDKLLPGGFEIRFFRVDPDMTVQTFDTLSKVQGYTTFNSLDFTQDGTEFWGYFTAPLLSTPVYCFWLKGKKEAGITPNNVYGIIQPREATDRDPLNVYGFKMLFSFRVNTNGENDFRKKILQ
jgi:hypothetical protein